MRKIDVGDKVHVMLYNTAGTRKVVVPNSGFISTIEDIDRAPVIKNEWQRDHPEQCRYKARVWRDGYGYMWVWQYEIKRVKR